MAKQNNNHLNQLSTLITKSQLNTIITNKDGTPDFLAINIYYDSLRSWYTPKQQYQSNGNVVQIKKLKTQGIYSRAEDLAKTHGVSKETIRKKIVKLEKLGLIQRSFKHKYHCATHTYNQRIIYVLQETPYFFNSYGIAKEEIKEITPQTNAEYIEEKYSIVFTSQTKQTKLLEAERGIHTLEDTKELREPFNKLKDRSNESTFFNNSNPSSLQPETPILVEAKNEGIPEEGGAQAIIHALKLNKPYQSAKPANQRKKLTNDDNKCKM
jgi:biotin operon repressor